MALSIGAPRTDDDQERMLTNILYFVKTKVKYIADPVGIELVKAPDAMLADIIEQGYTAGDCDDHCLLLATMLESVGIPSRIIAVKLDSADGLFNHVIVQAFVRMGWRDYDPCAKSKPQPLYTEKYII